MPNTAMCGNDCLQPSKHSSDIGVQAFETDLQDRMIRACSKLLQAWPGLADMEQVTQNAFGHKSIAYALMYLSTNHTLVSPFQIILCHSGLYLL